jgi:paraquat-inducible protein A
MHASDESLPTRGRSIWIACPLCGNLQSPSGAKVQRCHVCRSELERQTGRSLDLALALSAATFLLLIPANLAPFLTTAALGAVRESRLISGPAELWREGWPPLGLLVALVLIVAPPTRFALLAGALGALRLGRRDRWIGPVFRWANSLQAWAMSDVALLALWIAYARLSATVPTSVGVGARCFIAAGVLGLFTRAALNKPAIWRLVRRPRPVDASRHVITCDACGYLAPARALGRRCARCAARLHENKPQAASRAAAFALAALMLYLPANLFPMATIPINLEPSSYTVLEGVKDLFEAHLYGLGLLVFSASFAVPLLKLGGLSWFLVSVLTHSRAALVQKTRLYGVVEEIGRWSMVDPLVIACFVPVMQFNAKLFGRAGPAAVAFSAVVMLTMLATRAFDPRRLWNAARRPA